MLNLEISVDYDSYAVTILVNNSITLTVEKLEKGVFKYRNFNKLADELDEESTSEKLKMFAISLLE